MARGRHLPPRVRDVSRNLFIARMGLFTTAAAAAAAGIWVLFGVALAGYSALWAWAWWKA
jgi:hypothetical protein